MSKQERLANDEFLTRLTSLLAAANTAAHGSVFLTQKPLSTSSDQILIRATNGENASSKAKVAKAHKRGKKVKIATVVEQADLEAFYVKYADVCRAGMGAMRKRDKKKGRERAKAKKKGKTGGAT